MDVYEKIEKDCYKNTVDIIKMNKRICSNCENIFKKDDNYCNHCGANVELDYKKSEKLYKESLALRSLRGNEIMEEFKKDCLEYCELTNHQKADKIFEFAWEHGHSSGYSEVMYWMEEIESLVS